MPILSSFGISFKEVLPASFLIKCCLSKCKLHSKWISAFVAIFSNLPSTFSSSSYSKSGRHLTSFTLPMLLFSLASLPVTYSIAFLRSTHVNAFPFLGKSRSSATYLEILHFPLHELISIPAHHVSSKTEEPEVCPFLACNLLLSLLFFFLPLRLHQRQSVKSTSSLSLSFSIRKIQKVSICFLFIQWVTYLLPFSSFFFLILLYPSILVFQPRVWCWCLSETAGQTRLITADP